MPNLVYAMLAGNNPKILKPLLLPIFRLLWYVTTLTDTFIYAWMVPEFKKGYKKILCCYLRKSRIHVIHVVPLPSVERAGNNLPLEPRR